MKPEQSEQRIYWCHGHMDENVPIEAVKQEQGLYLEEVGVVVDEEFTSSFVSPILEFVEKRHQLLGVQVVHREPVMESSLDGWMAGDGDGSGSPGMKVEHRK
jgi:hypothetical protein